MENNAKILICDENAEWRRKICEGLKSRGFRTVDEAESGAIALDMILSGSYDVAVIDLWLSGIDGIGVMRGIEKEKFKNLNPQKIV